MENLEKVLLEVQQWHKSQQNQTSGYEYEKTFDLMWQKLGKKVLQQSVGELPTDKNKKKR
jgi:hypothetical protein